MERAAPADWEADADEPAFIRRWPPEAIWGSRGCEFKSRQPDIAMVDLSCLFRAAVSDHRVIPDKPRLAKLGARLG